MSTNVFDFYEKLKEGMGYESVLDSIYSKTWNIEHKKDLEIYGIDRLFTHRKLLVRYSVQYKSDPRSARSKQIFIETKSNVEKDIPGWIYSCIAQLIVYYIPPLKVSYLVSVNLFRKYLPVWIEQYGHKLIDVSNKRGDYTYTTRGFIVPVNVFELIVYGKQKRRQ